MADVFLDSMFLTTKARSSMFSSLRDKNTTDILNKNIYVKGFEHNVNFCVHLIYYLKHR